MEEIQQLTFDFAKVQPHILNRRNDEEIKLQLGEFDGPLDLLLFLIKQEQANIFDIPIAKIAAEYLRYLRLMETLDITIAGDFLVMAATLIDIKSKMLLPREPLAELGEEEIDDPRKELVDRLLEHQKFKNASQMLWEKSTVEQSIFTRGKIESDETNSEVNVGIFDLLSVFQKIVSRQKEEIQMEIQREEMTLAEMLVKLKQRILGEKRISINDFFSGISTKRELVVAFMAVLELVRTTSVRLLQDKVFGEIFALND